MGDLEDIRNDWVILMCPTIGVNIENDRDKILRFLQICADNHCVTMGEGHTGSDVQNGGREKFYSLLPKNCIVGEASFDSAEDVAAVLKTLKEEDLGISIVVSGIIDEVDHICKQVGTPHHTVSSSLGIWGRTDKLPSKQVLAISTMCGHGLIAHALVEDMVDRVRKGRITAEDAAWEMAKDCVCGIYNPHRAARLLQAMADQPE